MPASDVMAHFQQLGACVDWPDARGQLMQPTSQSCSALFGNFEGFSLF